MDRRSKVDRFFVSAILTLSGFAMLNSIYTLGCKKQESSFVFNVPPLDRQRVSQGWFDPQMTVEERKDGEYYHTAIWYKKTIDKSMLITYKSKNVTDHIYNVPHNIKKPTDKLEIAYLDYPERQINKGDIIVTWDGKTYTVIGTTATHIVLNNLFEPMNDSSPFVCIRSGCEDVKISFIGE